jgi:hypothetical protein
MERRLYRLASATVNIRRRMHVLRELERSTRTKKEAQAKEAEAAAKKPTQQAIDQEEGL